MPYRNCEYLSIANWRRYQHYTKRNPPWVKFYVDILLDPEFRSSRIGTRLLQVLLLAVAGRHGNVFPANADWLSIEIGMPRNEIRNGLRELREQGFLIPASNSASNLASAADEMALAGMLGPETETETETENPPYPPMPELRAMP